MKLFNLSLRNLKKSMKNYLIYFVTLILGVAIFYVFSSLGSQKVLVDVLKNDKEIIDIIEESLAGVSVFVAIILGFLIVYASTFLMKRRKKEFGIYMILGMSKRKIASILVIETLIIGCISLGIGLALGVISSQVISVIIANMFEANMTKFEFVISYSAIVKTIIYFCVMYGVVLILDVFIVGKTKLINLINAGKKAEKNTAKNPVLCMVIFIISAILLGSAYYKVTVGFEDISSGKEFLIQIAKGVIGNFGVFWSVSGFFQLIVKSNKKFYYKNLNSFTTNELSSRINTTVFSAGIICLMLFLTICILSCSMALKHTMDETLKKCNPCDVMFTGFANYNVNSENIEEKMNELGIETSHLDFKCAVNAHRISEDAFYESEYFKDFMLKGNTGFPVSYCLTESEYNKIAEVTHSKKVKVDEGKYVVVCNYDYYENIHNKVLKDNKTIDVYGQLFYPEYTHTIEGFIELSPTESELGFFVLPDSTEKILTGKEKYTSPLIYADYNITDEKQIEEYEIIYRRDELGNTIEEEDWDLKDVLLIHASTKRVAYLESTTVTVLVVFIGLYIGMIFMISGAAILALKVLSEAADNKEKYEILRKIGTDSNMINKSLLWQCIIYFGLPLGIAVIHSFFGIRTGLHIMESFGHMGLASSVISTAIVIGIIYGGYCLLTYLGSKRIINEK